MHFIYYINRSIATKVDFIIMMKPYNNYFHRDTFSVFSSLQYLKLHDNLLGGTTNELILPLSLTELYLSNNLLTSLELKSVSDSPTQLYYITLQHNQLTSMPEGLQAFKANLRTFNIR